MWLIELKRIQADDPFQVGAKTFVQEYVWRPRPGATSQHRNNKA